MKRLFVPVLYSAKIRKGNYNAVAAIYEPSYAHNALNDGLPENEHRLEFWAWNFIADRDTPLLFVQKQLYEIIEPYIRFHLCKNKGTGVGNAEKNRL